MSVVLDPHVLDRSRDAPSRPTPKDRSNAELARAVRQVAVDELDVDRFDLLMAAADRLDP